ncbi:MAG: GPW/gp25 family protein [Betaproteobacteria bacterium]|nr:GPW/gp25 family protein [Betaproteobacteria bacterium]
MNIRFPFKFDSRGRTALAGDNDHILQMIEQLVFTQPGERVNRPDFGTGLMQLLFAPNSPELAATIQFTLQAELQRYLGDLIDLQNLEVWADDSTLSVDIQYVVRLTSQPRTATLSRTV